MIKSLSSTYGLEIFLLKSLLKSLQSNSHFKGIEWTDFCLLSRKSCLKKCAKRKVFSDAEQSTILQNMSKADVVLAIATKVVLHSYFCFQNNPMLKQHSFLKKDRF